MIVILTVTAVTLCAGENPHDQKCWMYYPEDDCPFYRCTVFSHYAEKNCPGKDTALPTQRLGDPSLPVPDASARAGPYWSLMFEVSENKTYKPVNLDTIVEVAQSCWCTRSVYNTMG